ncbi:MAG: peptide deformylase [Candidatus Vogelbacteria bacterium]|nr:peptide deformylase [Candidatus Vogelbacteria bacterium]
MIITPILQNKHPILRLKTKPLDVTEISSTKIQKVISQMIKTLESCPDGVAIAAPQIGASLPIFIVSMQMIEANPKVNPRHLVFINPKITKLSKKKIILDEGCLSVRNIYGKTRRAVTATVEACDQTGKKFTWTGRDLMAQVFQHEVDHLNGILFTDHATDLETIVETSKTND